MRKVVGCLFLLACADTSAPPAPRDIAVTNHLLASVIVSGALTTDTIAQFQSRAVTVRGDAASIHFSVVGQLFTDGAGVPRGLDSASIALDPAATTAQVTNVIAGTPYYIFNLFQETGVAVDLAVLGRGGMQCMAALNSGHAIYRFGYFAWSPASEVRLYRGGTGCVGPFQSFGSAVLQDWSLNSGIVDLNATTAP